MHHLEPDRRSQREVHDADQKLRSQKSERPPCLTPRIHKEATLYKLLEYENPASSMIFCNTREETRLSRPW